MFPSIAFDVGINTQDSCFSSVVLFQFQKQDYSSCFANEIKKEALYISTTIRTKKKKQVGRNGSICVFLRHVGILTLVANK